MVTIIAFYPVGGEFDRHSFDTATPYEIFKTLLDGRKNENIKMYYNVCKIEKPLRSKLEQAGIFCLYDMERDYNDEEIDGGFWMSVMPMLDEEAEKILDDLFS